jgi:hypothetical protein
MKLTLEKIKNMSDNDKILYEKFIRRFLCKLSPTELRKAQIILYKEPSLISRARKNINKSFKVIKSKRINLDKRVIHITKTESEFSNCNSQSKFCTKCKEFKMLSEFPKHSNCCKDCKKISSIDYDVIILEGYGKECKQCLDFNTWDKYVYCKNTSDKKSIYCRDCLSLNAKLRLQTNLNLRLSHTLRGRINTVLKENKKSASTEELIGCTIDEFKYRFERLFMPGMTWDNHGTGKNGKGMQEWHIDHIIPCAKFDLSKPEEQRKCFNWSNLQPLWAKENLEKSDN